MQTTEANTINTNDTNLPATAADPLETLRQVAAAEGAGPKLLKYKKGVWSAGPDGEVLAIGTKLIAGIPSAVFGWRKWVDGEIADERLVSAMSSSMSSGPAIRGTWATSCGSSAAMRSWSGLRSWRLARRSRFDPPASLPSASSAWRPG